MKDWTLESLRRAIIAAALAAIVIYVSVPWIRYPAILAILVFFVTLIGNPANWYRKLSYFFAMAAAAGLVNFGHAITAQGQLSVGTENIAGDVEFWLNEGSILPGALLLGASVLFGWFDYKYRTNNSSNSLVDAHVASQLYTALRDENGNLTVTCILPVLNSKPHNISITNVVAKPFGFLDVYLITSVDVMSVVTLETISGGTRQEQVEFTADDPLVWESDTWKRFRVKIEVDDRLGPPSRFWRLPAWILGLHRRTVWVHLEEIAGQVAFSLPAVVDL